MSISQNSTNLILDTKRHSFAHLVAAAVGKMFPEAQFGVGPVIENGCYYDFVLPRNLIPEDLVLLEGHLKEMLKAHLSFKVQEMDIDQAIAHFDKANQPLKVELLMDLKTKGTTSMSEEEKADFGGVSIHAKLANLLEESHKTDKELYIDTIICNDKGQIFVQQRTADRKKFPNCWELVGGGVEEDETFEQTARRELKEELNFELLEIIDCLEPFDYTLPEEMRKDGENINHRILPVFVKVKDYSNPILEAGKAVEFAWIDSGNLEMTKNPGNNYTFDTVQKALERNVNKFLTPKITLYRIVNESTGEILFEDLCKGPHITHVKEIKNIGFKLDKFSAAYWRGDQARGINMQRLYALVYDTKEELATYIEQREEAKKRDHRVLGEQLNLFSFSELVGKGLPLWLPKGRQIQILLEKWAEQEEKKQGYSPVATPLITKENLFYTSGHLPHYKDSMYAAMEVEGENYYIKPMNCPFHHQIFAARPRSYKELPLRFSEYGFCHRYEDSGALFGLMRVRGMKMNDAHIYCTRKQAVDEFVKSVELIKTYFGVLGITDYYLELALRNPENAKYHDDEEMWAVAEGMSKEALEKAGVPYTIEKDGAAFYGPKIDIQVKSITGKVFTASTSQIDLYMPQRFGLEFVNENNERETPVVIHRAPLSTHERMIGFLIEHFAGKFPFWLAPEQIRILTLNDAVLPFVDKVKAELDEVVLMKPLKYNELRYTVDTRMETLGKKIRDAKLDLIPMLIVIGPKDVEAGEVSVEYAGKSFKVKVGELEALLDVVG